MKRFRKRPFGAEYVREVRRSCPTAPPFQWFYVACVHGRGSAKTLGEKEAGSEGCGEEGGGRHEKDALCAGVDEDDLRTEDFAGY